MPAQARNPARFNWRVPGLVISNFYNSSKANITTFDRMNAIFVQLNLFKKVLDIQLQSIVVMPITPELLDLGNDKRSSKHYSRP